MKLYTEEQVMDIILDSFISEYPTNANDILLNYKPIELPSDEEIEEGLFHHSNEYAHGYKDAFNWMRYKIGDNK